LKKGEKVEIGGDEMCLELAPESDETGGTYQLSGIVSSLHKLSNILQ
jgi:hypothetical protein